MRNVVAARPPCSNIIRTKVSRNSVLYTNMLHNCDQWKMLWIIFNKKLKHKKRKRKNIVLCIAAPSLKFTFLWTTPSRRQRPQNDLGQSQVTTLTMTQKFSPLSFLIFVFFFKIIWFCTFGNVSIFLSK